MARLIPDRLGRKLGQELRVMHRLLKKLPDDFQIWFPFGHVAEEPKPQIFVLWREKYAFLIQVADTSQKLAESAVQGDFFRDPEQILDEQMIGAKEGKTLNAFLEAIMSEVGPLAGKLRIRRLVVFPNVQANTIDEIVVMRGSEDQISYLGLRQANSEHFCRQLEALAESALPPPVIRHLRQRLQPESIVPGSFRALAPIMRDGNYSLPDGFLDFDQEWCVKNDLELIPEHESILENRTRVKLVTGVAGSGKTLVLLYRALLFSKENPHAKCLILTHNKALVSELERRAELLSAGASPVEARSFFSWAGSMLWNAGQRRKRMEPIGPERTAEIVSGLKSSAESGISSTYITDEIGWIKDQAIGDLETYLTMERKGRSIAWRTNQRHAFWRIFMDYQRHLSENDMQDWHDIALRSYELVTSRPPSLDLQYDAIFIDEAQFFAKTWFETINASLRPGGHLFLSADPTQGFLRRRQTWISAGISIGSSTRLIRPYRNTRAILAFARDFYYERRISDDEENLNIPDDDMLESIDEHGIPPELVRVSSPQDEIATAVKLALKFRDSMKEGSRLLILVNDPKRLSTLCQLLTLKFGKDAVHVAKDEKRATSAFCSLISIDAATGLEAPVVILLGMDLLLAKENDPTLSVGEKADLRRDNTRKLYMAFTRAGQRLLITRTGATSS